MAIKLGSGGGGGTPISATVNFVDKNDKFTDETGVEWLQTGTLLIDPANAYPDVAKKDVFYHDASKHTVATFSTRAQNQIQGFAGPTGNVCIGAYYRNDSYKYQYMWASFDATSNVGEYGQSFPNGNSNHKYYGVNFYHAPNAPVGNNSAKNSYDKNAMGLRCDQNTANDTFFSYSLYGSQTPSEAINGRILGQIASTYLRNSNTTGTTAERALFAGMPTPSVPRSHIFFDHVNNKLYALVYLTLDKSSHASNHKYSQLHEWDWSQHTNFRSTGAMNNTYNVATASTFDPFNLKNVSDAVCSNIGHVVSDKTYLYVTYYKLISGEHYQNVRRLALGGVLNWAGGTDMMDDFQSNDGKVWKDNADVTNALTPYTSTLYYNLKFSGVDTNGDNTFSKHATNYGFIKGVMTEAFGSTTLTYDGQAYTYLRIK